MLTSLKLVIAHLIQRLSHGICRLASKRAVSVADEVPKLVDRLNQSVQSMTAMAEAADEAHEILADTQYEIIERASRRIAASNDATDAVVRDLTRKADANSRLADALDTALLSLGRRA